ncbi:2-amino-4-hydroxy-6-hydroxymethyldihydropteridine diphosphokinase, partial [Legionella londiniensis]
MIPCYLALGSNLRSPERQLRQAIAKLKQLPASSILKISSIYLSLPLGAGVQPHYCNLVLSLRTRLPPHCLLDYCQRIENKHQRVRKKKWGARTLDIDILLYGRMTISSSRLTIPHPEMVYRDFVMTPLLEISPHLNLPKTVNTSVLELPKRTILKVKKNNSLFYKGFSAL